MLLVIQNTSLTNATYMGWLNIYEFKIPVDFPYTKRRQTCRRQKKAQTGLSNKLQNHFFKQQITIQTAVRNKKPASHTGKSDP
jgi:hypothetical protein